MDGWMDVLPTKVLSLRMLLHDRDAKLVVMERALQHQRELLSRSARTAKMEMNLRCKTQKVTPSAVNGGV